GGRRASGDAKAQLSCDAPRLSLRCRQRARRSAEALRPDMSEPNDFKRMNAPIRDLIEQVQQQLATKGPVQDRPQADGCSCCGGRGFVPGRNGALATATLCGCDLRCSKCSGRG